MEEENILNQELIPGKIYTIVLTESSKKEDDKVFLRFASWKVLEEKILTAIYDQKMFDHKNQTLYAIFVGYENNKKVQHGRILKFVSGQKHFFDHENDFFKCYNCKILI